MAIIAAVALLVAAGIAIYKNWDFLKEKAGVIFTKIKEFFLGLWNVAKSVGTKIKDFFIFVWEQIKNGFNIAVGFMQKIFFTFADYFLTVWGTIIKGVLSAVSGIGSALGFDTSAIEGVIAKVEGLQSDVRSKSFFGDIGGNNETGQVPPQAMAYAGAGAGGGVNRTENINVASNVSIQVPQGTPASQQEFLNNQARNVFQQEMQKAISGAKSRNRRTE